MSEEACLCPLHCPTNRERRGTQHVPYVPYRNLCQNRERQGKMQIVNIYSGGLSLRHLQCKMPYNIFRQKKNSQHRNNSTKKDGLSEKLIKAIPIFLYGTSHCDEDTQMDNDRQSHPLCSGQLNPLPANVENMVSSEKCQQMADGI